MTALGWPLLLAIALSLPTTLAIERAFVVSFAVALIVGERWRDAQRQRDAEVLDAFLRALESEDRAFAPTMHASLERRQPPPLPPLGRPRPRAIAPPQRPSERPTVPD